MKHLLVTNDYPPKVGGIQNYLWELWRRLPADDVCVLTTPHDGAVEFDAAQDYRVVRSREPFLLPYPWLVRRITELADDWGAELIILDPALPLGLIGPRLKRRYGVVLHGAEVTVPGRLPVSRQLLAHVLADSELTIAAGGYPLAEGERALGRSLPSVVVPPGVDTARFQPLGPEARRAARQRHGFDPDAPLVVAGSRLVPRKGVDTLIDAVARLAPRHPGLSLAVSGSGRDRRRLEQRARRQGAPVRFLGRIPDDEVPQVYGMGDVFSIPCRVRWGGLEQEGFGIVFLEAAAAGVPQVAGASGGAHEAVDDGITGFVVDPPDSADAVAAAISRLLDDPEQAQQMGAAARARAVTEFDYGVLANRLAGALASVQDRP
ncbi:MAG: glycosyltransferase family 4 protein [Actinomycetia bacterium]|nr:glycosyltransferase family 4 protein [Actinomycetes bacterium]